MPEISIIILTLNSTRFIRGCLESIFTQGYHDFEVIVVDNGSKDGTVDFIKENYSSVILIENKNNLGACKARNQAIEIAKGEWIFTLDCDTILEKDFLQKMMNFIKKSEEFVGMFQPKILKLDKKTVSSCGIYLSILRRFHDIGKEKPDNGKFNTSKNIFGVCSAAAFYKRQMLEEIREDSGYFDERFFFLVEDVDLSWRAQRRGWKAKYYPEAICYHFGNSASYEKKFRQYLCFRNRYLLLLKNENIFSLIMRLPFLITYDIPRLFYLFLFNKYTFKTLSEVIRLEARTKILC